MVEWQTRRTQNPLSAMTCGFKSHHRHHEFQLHFLVILELFLCLYCAVSINSPLLSISFFCKRALSATKIRVVTRKKRVTTLFCRSKFPPIVAHSAGVSCPSAHVGGCFFACLLGGRRFWAYSSIFLSSMQLSLMLP